MDIFVEAPPGHVFAGGREWQAQDTPGEDWRRSSHNATVRAWDVPAHHNVGDFVTMARQMSTEDADIHVFGHGLLNAYRQWRCGATG